MILDTFNLLIYGEVLSSVKICIHNSNKTVYLDIV
jgi:hypothetical protein